MAHLPKLTAHRGKGERDNLFQPVYGFGPQSHFEIYLDNCILGLSPDLGGIKGISCHMMLY